MGRTIKQGIILAIARAGVVKDARDLQSPVGWDEHNIIHCLHSMSRQDIAKFRLQRTGRVQALTHIRLTRKGQRIAEELNRGSL